MLHARPSAAAANADTAYWVRGSDAEDGRCAANGDASVSFNATSGLQAPEQLCSAEADREGNTNRGGASDCCCSQVSTTQRFRRQNRISHAEDAKTTGSASTVAISKGKNLFGSSAGSSKAGFTTVPVCSLQAALNTGLQGLPEVQIRIARHMCCACDSLHFT